jgi:CDP-glycerol glycerophosphotransferase (TagB/SpsB family)
MGIRLFLQRLRRVLFTWLSYLIPKKKGLIVFYPTHHKKGFSGNLKSYFIYLNNCPEKSKYTAVWCTNNEDTYRFLKSQNYKVAKGRFAVHLNLLRASHIIQDSTYTWLLGRFSVIQLWHGNGFKNSALLDTTNTPKKLVLLRKVYSQYKMIAASSEVHQDLMIRSFENERVAIVGSPKNDVFYDDPSLPDKIKARYNLSHFDKIYAYTPTFRDKGVFDPFQDEFWAKLNVWLVANNVAFVVKKHPWDKTLKVPDRYKNILDLSSTISDVQELLLVSDLLISDYSAIVTDFAITGKPILYYFHDFDNYTQMRSFYYDLKAVLPGPFIYDSETLLSYLKDLSWFEAPDYQVEFQAFLSRFHTYMDGNSSKRVLEEMKRLTYESAER